jgi:hypothetical protein
MGDSACFPKADQLDNLTALVQLQEIRSVSRLGVTMDQAVSTAGFAPSVPVFSSATAALGLHF